MTIVFDRYRGIISAVNKVYPVAHNISCCYHLSYNMVIDIHDKPALGLFWATTRANTIIQYNQVMQTMLDRRGYAYRWLQNIESLK